MATLAKEWISLDQAHAWLDTYDHRWCSEEVIAALARELEAGTCPHWVRALIVDAHTNHCIDGLTQLEALVSRGRGGQRWVARATDCVFVETTAETTSDPGALLLITRREDSVETHRFRMTPLGGAARAMK